MRSTSQSGQRVKPGWYSLPQTGHHTAAQGSVEASEASRVLDPAEFRLIHEADMQSTLAATELGTTGYGKPPTWNR